MKDTGSCPNAGCRSSKECDKLHSKAEHPKGNAGVPIPYKFINRFIGTAALVWRIYLPTKPE